MLYTLWLKIVNEIEISENKTPVETTTKTQFLNMQEIETENRLDENPTNMS